jgi:hypothetical protein
VSYDLLAHRHRFAVWTAARAVQRAFHGSCTSNCNEALEKSGVTVFVGDASYSGMTDARFNELHVDWCRRILAEFIRLGSTGATYGRSAKLVAVYLKTMIVVGGFGYTDFGRVLHPRIDETLLGNLAGSPVIQSPHKDTWADVTWTSLDEPSYYSLIDQLLGSCTGRTSILDDRGILDWHPAVGAAMSSHRELLAQFWHTCCRKTALIHTCRRR